MKFDDKCWTRLGMTSASFSDTKPFNEGFLNHRGAAGCWLLGRLVANHQAAMELMGCLDPE